MKSIVIWGTSLQKVADEAHMITEFKILSKLVPDAQVTLLTHSWLDVAINYPELKIVPAYQFHRWLGLMRKADLFVVAGGPFYEKPLQLLKCAVLFSWAKLWKVPILIFGVTVFPITQWWGKAGYRAVVEKSDHIMLRDRIARQTLIDIGVKNRLNLGTDPRILLKPVSTTRVREILISEGLDPDQPLIGITTRHMHSNVPGWVKRTHKYEDKNVTRSNTAVSQAVDRLSRLGQVFIIPMHPDVQDDLETAEYIRSHMSNREKLKVLGKRYLAEEVVGLVGACSMFFAARLGSALFCSITATPLLSIAYEARMTDLMDKLKMSDYVIDWTNIDLDTIAPKIDKLWANRNQVSDQLKQQSEKLIREAWASAEIYRTMLGMSAPG